MLDERISAALAHVYDPCSIAAGRPTSLVDMGLLIDARIEAGTAHATFCVTFAGCTMAPHFIEAARVELAKIEGVEHVETRVDTNHAWTPIVPRPMRGEPQAWRTHPSRDDHATRSGTDASCRVTKVT
jgi:metal-sulfur cluster biosynthetic enzyme